MDSVDNMDTVASIFRNHLTLFTAYRQALRRGIGWQAIAKRRAVKIAELESKLDTATKALDILTQ